MSRLGKITRRSFMVGSVAVVGGVAFGGYYISQPAANPLIAGQGEAALTPFVFIDQNGVTLIAPRAEMGQGVRTTLGALIAEELDVELEDVNVIHGPAAKAYYNAALMSGLPGYDAGENLETIGAKMMGTLSKLMGLQITGGSTSIKDAYVRLRKAGASARETLKEACARQINVARRDLITKNGFVIAPNGDRYRYSDLAPLAADLKVIENVDLKPASQWRYLGRSVPRVDMVEKVTGTAVYASDVRLPGMKFAALRMNPNLGGAMIGFDPTLAEQMPGVEGVYSLGGGVCAVAKNSWLAQKALETLSFEWEKAPYPETTDKIFETIEQAFDAEPNSTLHDDGSVEEFAQEPGVLEASYRVPYLAHATMEPMNATALLKEGKLTVWCGNQGPVVTQAKCAEAVGLAPEQVEIITTYMGGGFGRRAEIDFSVYAAKLAQQMEGTPVQLLWSREEDMTHDFYRPGALARFKGVVKDEKLVMLDAQIASQSCDFQFMGRLGGPSGGEDKVLVDGLVDQPYGIENYRVRGYLADLNVPVGFWRAVGYSVNGFMMDTFIDEMAVNAGLDPLVFRINMINEVHGPSAKVLETVREMSNWRRTQPEGVGLGVGFTYSFGTPVAIVIRLEEHNGLIKMTNAWITCDIGLALDPDIVKAQMISGMVYGLSAACYEEITFDQGQVVQKNFPDYDMIRHHTMPKTEVRILQNNRHMGGAGEPSTPPAMPAIANALFNLTGRRARELPLNKSFNLLV